MNEHSKTIRIVLHNGNPAGSGNAPAPRIGRNVGAAAPVVSKVQETSAVAPAGEPSAEPKRYRCPHCGATLETDEPIEGTQVPCPECEKEFVAEALAKPIVRTGGTPAATTSASETPAKKPGKGKIPLWVILVVLLAGGAGLWFLSGTTSKVNPSLVLRPEATYSTAFGGRVAPEAYSFSSTDFKPYDAFHAGNPIYFMRPLNVTWSCYKASPGERHIFRRNDEYIVDSPRREDKWSMLPVTMSMSISFGQTHGDWRYFGYNARSTTAYAAAIQTNALRLGSVFPAPVVMADDADDSRFCYLNDYGRPSVVMWGVSTNCWFRCLEGEHALSGYARVLRELRQVMADCSQKAKDQGLRTATQPIHLRTLPDIYIGNLDAGTREKASVSYEFIVENFQCKIKEKTECSRWRCSCTWTPELLDEDLAFFSRFETKASTKKAFEPLYCYLSQRKITIEEENAENRSGKSGKKTQQLTFEPIGEQTTTSRVELSATAESGGKVIFSVDRHLGKIEGNILSFTGAGTVGVIAKQWGNDTWRSAEKMIFVDVVKSPQTVDFSPIGPQEQSAKVELSATSDSGKDVSFKVTSGPGRISNGVLSFYGYGSVEVMATVEGDDIWEKASATQTVEVRGVAGSKSLQNTPDPIAGAQAIRQKVHIAPIGPQDVSARVRLSATADSGNAVSFRVVSGPGKIENGILSFTGAGRVMLLASAAGNDLWEEGVSTVNITVTGKAPSAGSEASGDGQPSVMTQRSSGSFGRTANSSLEAMLAALEAARVNPDAAIFRKLETTWAQLPPEQKDPLQKNVMWAICAMLLSEGNTAELAKRRESIDFQTLLRASWAKCPTCGGDGRVDETCRKCGGTGKCKDCHGSGVAEGVLTGRKVPCPTCKRSGRCPECSGGTNEIRCTNCSGSGRVRSKAQCMSVVNENLDEALRICREMKVVGGGELASHERSGRGQSAAPPERSRGEASSPFQAALQAARNHPNLKTFEHLETVLDTLSDEEKAVLQTPVMTAFCAMLLAADNRSGLSARMKFVNYRSLLQSVKTPCEACGGDGRLGQTCTECGGTGKCKYCHGSGMTEGHLTGRKMPCPTCNSKGRCPACSGGQLQITCKTCSGSGRVVSKTKCREVVNQNLDEAIRLYREMK